ncbi:hypothetical protein DB30_04254 [Enhygromyxa salina]|uniref:Uncharacterized protein n=1 Tax=Enhygromyxa salina TaxID=215803 RepID=A0A0C2D4M6_9BACT|nr:hypothetical protein DB30_04254 [Enhygromyxa salina]
MFHIIARTFMRGAATHTQLNLFQLGRGLLARLRTLSSTGSP